MRIVRNFILTLCIISFFSLGNLERIDAAFFLLRKQANIGFVGLSNSGRTVLRLTLANLPFDFFEAPVHNILQDSLRFSTGLVLDDGHGHNYAIDCKLWDTSGHPSDKNKVIDFRCKYMDIVVITVSLADPDWREEITRNVLEWQNRILDINPNAKIILACTKSDLVDPNDLGVIESTINNFTNGVQALGESVRGVVLSARTVNNLDVLMHIIEDDLREIGLVNLRDIHEEMPNDSCLLL